MEGLIGLVVVAGVVYYIGGKRGWWKLFWVKDGE
jgi:hypothetical protein